MKRLTCDTVRDRMPELAREGVGPEDGALLRSHLEECSACAGEWQIVRLVSTAPRVRAPDGLEERVRRAAAEALRERRTGPASTDAAGGGGGAGRRRRVPSWGLAAAAGVVLALGTPLLVQRMQTPLPGGSDTREMVGDEVAAEVQQLLPTAYVSDDPVVAGAPVFDGLSDDALLALLEEMGG